MSNEIHVKITKYTDRKFWLMYYLDPITEKMVSRSTKEPTRRGAECKAGAWQADLLAGRYRADTQITWADFRTRYEDEKLASLAERSQTSAATALNHVERTLDPKRLRSITSATLSEFQAKLRQGGMIDTTIAAHLTHLQAALSWAVSIGLLPAVPEMHKPKRAKGQKLMRGRPITAEEFDRMIEAVPKVRPHDAAAWVHYLTGLWLSGLRLTESLALSWDPDGPFTIDLSGKHPRLRIYAEAEKGHQDRLLPMTPDFAEWILETPEAEREGPVFRLVGLNTGQPLCAVRIGRIVSAIGKKAGVVVNRTKRGVKYATAHDLRRAFGTRWARRLKTATLQRIMRHTSIGTTMAYYVDIDADDVADELWREHEKINTRINSPPPATSDSNEGTNQEKQQPFT